MILLTLDCKALFGWRKQKITDDKQSGVNCFVFRNEGNILSSELIKEADELAWNRWGDSRHYTYVNKEKIASKHAGYCFIMAGWDYQRDDKGKPILTKGGLYILERFSPIQ